MQRSLPLVDGCVCVHTRSYFKLHEHVSMSHELVQTAEEVLGGTWRALMMLMGVCVCYVWVCVGVWMGGQFTRQWSSCAGVVETYAQTRTAPRPVGEAEELEKEGCCVNLRGRKSER